MAAIAVSRATASNDQKRLNLIRRVGLEVVDLRERVDDPGSRRLAHGEVQALLPGLEVRGLDQGDLEPRHLKFIHFLL